MSASSPPLTKVLFVFVVLGAAAALIVWKYSGDLINDIRVAGTPMMPSEARVVADDCTRYNFVVSACSIAYVDPKSAQPGERRQLDYLLFGSVAGERYGLLQPQSHPGIVTSNIGLDHLGNRVATLLGLLGAIALILLGVFRRLQQTPRDSDGPSHNYDDAIERALQAHAQTQTAGSKPAMASRAMPSRTDGPAKGFGRRVR